MPFFIPVPTVLALTAALFFLSAPPSFAQAPNILAVPTDDEPTQTNLDMWLERLAAARDKPEADLAETHVQKIWMQSGSDTVDLLMGWALQSVNEKDYALALDLLDSVTTLKPDYAEGWNKRATVHYMQDDYGKAMADIEQALRIEPRHFGAISGLGMILRDLDRPEKALVALRRAMELHPFLDNIPELVEELEHKVGGDV